MNSLVAPRDVQTLRAETSVDVVAVRLMQGHDSIEAAGKFNQQPLIYCGRRDGAHEVGARACGGLGQADAAGGIVARQYSAVACNQRGGVRVEQRRGCTQQRLQHAPG